MGTRVQDDLLTSFGYEQISGAAAATGLTVPQNAIYALIQVLGQNVRWRDDLEDPTAAVGMQITAGDSLFFNGDLRNLTFIEEAASAEINVTYYA